jgi:uncharacterized repeat protein (TIGR03803 family)
MKTLKIPMLCLLLVAFVYNNLMAQRTCGSTTYLNSQLQTNPSMQTKRTAIENITKNYRTTSAKVSGKVTIPVVVHVIYNTAQQNISDAQIQSQIAVLNEDFQALNTDKSLTPSLFSGLIGDFQIQFVLASSDPNCNSTTGIERKSSSITSWGQTDNCKFAANGGFNAWNSQKYLNLWVCNIGVVPGVGEVLGYAQFPGGPSATDGVVVSPNFFGSSSKGTGFYLSSPFDKGRTLTHEVGHWLNLNHIWGDDGSDCTGSDNVTDTPNQASYNGGCPSYPHASCSNTSDMFMNYMDYTDDACMFMFSNGQKDRGRATFEPGGGRETFAVTDITGLASVCSNQTSVAYSVANNPGTVYTWILPASATIASGAGTNAITVNFNGTPSGTQIIKVTGNNIGTCKTKTITVNAAPTVTVSAQTPACGWPPTTFTAYGANTYVWNNGGNTSGLTLSSTIGTSIVATPINYFSYTVNVVGTAANGCSNTASKNMGPGALSSPTVNYISTNNSSPLMYGMSQNSQHFFSTQTEVIFEWNRLTNVYNEYYFPSYDASGLVGELRYYNGKYYGVSAYGGIYNAGSLFEWNPSTHILTKKIDFGGAGKGSYPSGSLLLVNNKFYGLTQNGGTNDMGTLYEWNPSTNVITNNIIFNGAGNGSYPYGNLRIYNSLLYGVTMGGGSKNMGTLFKYNISTNILTKADFQGGTLGSSPNTAPVLYNGKLYGTVQGGGQNELGLLYEWDPSTTIITPKVHFNGTLNGSYPTGFLTAYNNKLYGMTITGGANDVGTIFEWNPATSVIQSKISFNNLTNGEMPYGGLTLVGGKFYGMSGRYLIEWNPTSNVLNTKQNYIFGQGSLTEAYSNDYICSNDGINRVYTVGSNFAGTINWTFPSGTTIISGAGTNTITVNYGATAVSGTISVNGGTNGCGTSNTVTYPVVVTNCNQNSIANPRMAEEAEVSKTPATPLANFNVYPNPNNGLFNVSSDNQEATNVLVIDMMGNEVYKAQLEPNKILQVDLSDKAKGIYHLKIEGTKIKLINVQ